LAKSHTSFGTYNPSRTTIPAIYWATKGNDNDEEDLDHRLALARANAHANTIPTVPHPDEKSFTAENSEEASGSNKAVNEPIEYEEPSGLMPGTWPADDTDSDSEPDSEEEEEDSEDEEGGEDREIHEEEKVAMATSKKRAHSDEDEEEEQSPKKAKMDNWLPDWAFVDKHTVPIHPGTNAAERMWKERYAAQMGLYYHHEVMMCGQKPGDVL
jgi:hypothetical protein